jgi:tetratricopeptide (TPR) repeat protein
VLRSLRHIALVSAVSLALAAVAATDDFKTCVYDSGDVAIAACGRVIANPGSFTRGQVVEAYRDRGVEWYLKKDYDKAIDDASAAIRMDDGHSPSYYLRFKAWQQKGDEEHARADLDRAIKSDFNVEAFVARAEYREKSGDIAGAIADYKAALATRKSKYDYIGVDKVRDHAREELKRLSAK